jgi:hypothetical protein
MSFKIKDGIRIGLVDVFASNGQLLVPAPSLLNARKIELTGDVTGDVLFNGTSNVQITTSIAANSIELGTDTTGNYVANVSGTDGVTVTGGGVEGADITIVNSDKGSSQNIFKNIANSTGGLQITANNNNDTLQFAGTGGTQVSFDSNTKTITFSTTIPDEADTLQTVTTRGSTTNVAVSFTNGTASSNTTTGAVVVTGGVGVGGALNVGGDISTVTGALTTTAASAAVFNTGATTVNIGGAATTVGIGAATGVTTINNSLIVSGNLTVSGTTTFIDTTTLQVEDKNIELGKVVTPTNATADGGGISILAGVDGDKTWSWVSATNAWTSSEDINLVSGKEFKINNVLVANSSSLGSGITGSSLTSVGTIGAGVWQGSVIDTAYGGTGQSTYSNGQILIGNGIGGLTKNTLTAGDNITITNGNGSITIASLNTEYSAISNAEIVDSSHVTGELISGQAFVYGLDQLTTLQKVTERGATTNNAITITNTTSSSNTSTGALVVSGGIAANNLYVNNETRDGVVHVASKSTEISTVSETVVDTFPVATYRAGRFIIQVSQGSAYQVSEFRIIHDGTTTYLTEYAVLETSGELCSFTSDVNGGNVRIKTVMASATSATIKLNRTLITV